MRDTRWQPRPRGLLCSTRAGIRCLRSPGSASSGVPPLKVPLAGQTSMTPRPGRSVLLARLDRDARDAVRRRREDVGPPNALAADGLLPSRPSSSVRFRTGKTERGTFVSRTALPTGDRAPAKGHHVGPARWGTADVMIRSRWKDQGERPMPVHARSAEWRANCQAMTECDVLDAGVGISGAPSCQGT